MLRLLVINFILLIPIYSLAQELPKVGRQAAQKYFENRSPAASGGSSDHYLALHFGRFMGSQAYEWLERGKQENIGENSIGLTYRVGEWENSMDLNLRIDFNEYKIGEDRPLKMTLMPLLTFPDASSRFPLYFGFGAGLGVFFKQIQDESTVAFDYQLLMGARFFNVYGNTGFFIETGLKNHLHLLTSGQFNGTFLTLGAVFTF